MDLDSSTGELGPYAGEFEACPSQCEAVLCGPCADQMQWAEPVATIMRAAHRLAIDGDNGLRAAVFISQARDPRRETGLKRFGLQCGEKWRSWCCAPT